MERERGSPHTRAYGIRKIPPRFGAQSKLHFATIGTYTFGTGGNAHGEK